MADLLAAQTPENRTILTALRELILDEWGGAAGSVTEHFDQFSVRYRAAGSDRISLSIDHDGHVELMLWADNLPAGNGSEPASTATLGLQHTLSEPGIAGSQTRGLDPTGLLSWHSATRASLTIPTLPCLQTKYSTIGDLLRSWLASFGPRLADSEAEFVARLRTAGCVYAEDEVRVILSTSDLPEEHSRMVAEREAGRPLEYVVGWAEFCGLRVAIDDGVFVPRRRTEFLATLAASILNQTPGRPVVVDLCCGSGAVGLAVASSTTSVVKPVSGADLTNDLAAPAPRQPATGVELFAADLDPVAVECARRNIAAVGGIAVAGDLYAALPDRLRGSVAVLLANCPYVPTAEIDFLPAEARLYEPLATLDGGSDGLDVQRRVAAAAPLWLLPGGSLLIETSEHQAAVTATFFEAAGLRTRIASSEELGATVVIGVRPIDGATYDAATPR